MAWGYDPQLAVDSHSISISNVFSLPTVVGVQVLIGGPTDPLPMELLAVLDASPTIIIRTSCLLLFHGCDIGQELFGGVQFNQSPMSEPRTYQATSHYSFRLGQ